MGYNYAMSFPEELTTDNEAIRLIAPDVERDAELSMIWLRGEVGKNTLKLMGNVPKKIPEEPSLEFEKQRVTKFMHDDSQYNWMIEFDGKVVGTVWADIKASVHVPSPSIHIMIGDPEARGQGVGPAAMQRVINFLEEDYLKESKQDTIYSRHLLENTGATKLLEKLKFTDLGEPYSDKDNLWWQNMILDTKNRIEDE
jgi:RimJ/RimL family protein N-acetyltransferase